VFYTGIDDNVCPIEDHLLPLYRKLKELEQANLEVVIEQCDRGLNCAPPVTLAEILARWIKK
jgi:hypothetical protein